MPCAEVTGKSLKSLHRLGASFRINSGYVNTCADVDGSRPFINHRSSG
ncbi:hypothetical protein [Candidatus Glomeribacter gigasporarum]|nr:hypothetical protein [Candidatus Glomeribacter gigasporarum]